MESNVNRPQRGSTVAHPAHYNDRFPDRLRMMLDDAVKMGFKAKVSWSSDGTSFKIHNRDSFSERILPKYFHKIHFKSFQRQLNIYQFLQCRTGKNKGYYSNEFFVRDDPELAANMYRVQPKNTDKLNDYSDGGAFQRSASPSSFEPSSSSNEDDTEFDLFGVKIHPKLLPPSSIPAPVDKSPPPGTLPASNELQPLFQNSQLTNEGSGVMNEGETARRGLLDGQNFRTTQANTYEAVSQSPSVDLLKSQLLGFLSEIQETSQFARPMLSTAESMVCDGASRNSNMAGTETSAPLTQSPVGFLSEIQETLQHEDRKPAAPPAKSTLDQISDATDLLSAALSQRNRLGSFALRDQILRLDINAQQILVLALNSTGPSTTQVATPDIVDEIIKLLGSGIDHNEMG